MGLKLVSCASLAIAIAYSTAHSQTLSEKAARQFLTALCQNDSSVFEFIDVNDLKYSERLGIRYEIVFAKLLCSQVLESTTRAGIKAGTLDYRIKIDDLDPVFQKLTVSVSGINRPHEFYFRNGKFVLASSYYSQYWASIESKHFRFHFSDSSLVNSNAIERLELFFGTTAKLLEYSQEQLEIIGREKIDYLLCRNPREVEELTGYESRGMYELASDRIITCFGSHYHELVHLMVNFKLGTLPLRTHPFLQEGIAVALGGRGGIEKSVMMEMASFLVESGMANVGELLTTNGFMQSHSSLSYPICGLYCDFLLSQIGIGSFLDLYRRYSTTQENIDAVAIKAEDLPADSTWLTYVKERSAQHAIELAPSDGGFEEVYRDSSVVISMGPNQYLFRVREKVAFGSGIHLGNYRSSVFTEQFSEREYRGEQFAIVANSDEIKIYDLFTNSLIANLVGSFRIPPVTIANENGVFEFTVEQSVFGPNFELNLKKGD